MAYRLYLGSILLALEKRLALYVRLAYHKLSKLLDGHAGITRVQPCDGPSTCCVRVLALCKHPPPRSSPRQDRQAP
jgi:hypothetical protein